MEKKRHTKKLNDKDRATVQIQLRITPAEERGLKRLAKSQGEPYVARAVRNIIRDAVKQLENLTVKTGIIL